MIALAVALGLAAGPAAAGQAAPEATDLAARIRESAAAAQALQGPMDGTWTLSDARRRPLFVFQFTDPAGGAGPLEGAWRRSGASAPAGLIDAIARRGDHLAIRFAGGGEVVRVRLRRRADGTWSGEANENGHDLSVALRRSAIPTPVERQTGVSP
jgi:hypothetical protein